MLYWNRNNPKILVFVYFLEIKTQKLMYSYFGFELGTQKHTHQFSVKNSNRTNLFLIELIENYIHLISSFVWYLRPSHWAWNFFLLCSLKFQRFWNSLDEQVDWNLNDQYED